MGSEVAKEKLACYVVTPYEYGACWVIIASPLLESIEVAIFDLFSKRARRERGEMPDVFTYTDIPQPLRIQVVHIWDDAFGSLSVYDTQAVSAYQSLHNILCREYGVFELVERPSGNPHVDLANFLIGTQEVEKALDTIELSFQYIERVCGTNEYRYHSKPKATPQEAIAELNARFLEHGVGYSYEDGVLVRKDSEFLHSEVVRPALGLLRDGRYSGAHEEFLKAHEHYRHRRYKECLNECLKALESTLKTICDRKRWKYAPNATAKALIETCFANDLVPKYLQSEFAALRALLESGIPTVRNKASGHGQGVEVISVPNYLAAYVLHLTGATIVLLAEAAK